MINYFACALAIVVGWPTDALAQRLVLPLSIGVIAAEGLDLHSTSLVLRSGGAEGNPILARLPTSGRAALKFGLTTGVIVAAYKAKRAHPRLATMTLIVLGGFTTSAAVHNYRLARR